jgi:hypothetical protein
MTKFVLDLVKTLRLEGGQFVAAVTQTQDLDARAGLDGDTRPTRSTRRRRSAVSTIKVNDGLPRVGPAALDVETWRANVMHTLTQHLDGSADA